MFALVASGATFSHAAIPEKCTALTALEDQADCACAWALEQDSPSAQEEYLDAYGDANNACRARATTQLSRPDSEHETPPGSPN